jgi:hypothetical protein
MKATRRKLVVGIALALEMLAVATSGHLPGVDNRRFLRRSTRMMNQPQTAAQGLVVLRTHDPAAAPTLAEAAK